MVLEKPDVVVILVRVQGDLLLLATSGVHERVRVKITTLGVNVTDADTAAEHDVGRDILHALVVQGCLEFGAHETVTITRVLEAGEVDGKHGHVEGDRDDDKAEEAGQEVLGEQTLCGLAYVTCDKSAKEMTYHGNVLVVTKQNPELDQSDGTNPGNCEKANPLDAHGDTEPKTSSDEPKPPAELESLLRTKFMLVAEAGESKSSEGSGSDQRRIEQDQTSLRKETVLCVVSVWARKVRKPCRDRDLPKMMRLAPKTAVMVRQPTALRVRNIEGTSRIPQIAGNRRIAT